MTIHRAVLCAMLLAVPALLLAGCAGAPSGPERGAVESVPAPEVGTGSTAVYQSKPVPIGKAPPTFTLKRLGGGSVSLSSLRGKVVLLSFWTPSCPPCHLEAPHLQRLHRKYLGSGLRVVGVVPLTPLEGIRDFIQRHGVEYDVAVDVGEKTARRFGLAGYPAMFLLDRSGRVRRVRLGFAPGDERALEEDVRALLSQPRFQASRSGLLSFALSSRGGAGRG